MLFEVGPNLDSLGDTPNDLLFCVVDPLCDDLGNHDRKSISSFRHSEGRHGDPSSSLCFREGCRITIGLLCRCDCSKAICPPPLSDKSYSGQDGGHDSRTKALHNLSFTAVLVRSLPPKPTPLFCIPFPFNTCSVQGCGRLGLCGWYSRKAICPSPRDCCIDQGQVGGQAFSVDCRSPGRNQNKVLKVSKEGGRWTCKKGTKPSSSSSTSPLGRP